MDKRHFSIDAYQVLAHATADYPEPKSVAAHLYNGLELAGEAGEVAELLKKWYRDGDALAGIPVDHDKLVKELGDVFWSLAEIATNHGLSLNAIALENLAKLADRQKRGVIHGSGDDR